MSEYGFDTKRIHAGYNPKEHFNSVNYPIYQTAAFDLDSVDHARELWTGEASGGIYSRVGNPTVAILEERIRELDGGAAAVAVSSGMTAISFVALLLGQGGGNFVTASSLYGAAQEAFTHFYPKYGITAKFVENRDDISEYEKLIDDNTKAIYLESISNPNIEVYDFEKIAQVAHKHGVPLVIDNTIATPYLFRPFEHGADIIVYSATKGISGHGNTIAGLVVEKGGFTYSKERFPQFHEKSWKIRDLQDQPRTPLEAAPDAPVVLSLKAFYMEFFGANLGSFDAYLALQGISTLSERLSKQVASTKQIVEFLEQQPEVAWVRHPFAKDSKYKELAEKYFPKGAGAILSFGLNGSKEQLKQVVSALKVFSHHVNIGDVRSLVAYPAATTHTELTPDIHKLAGIEQNQLRLSIGLEDVNDLIADLRQALDQVYHN
ncbi:MAG: aminotransferase class I/II-fold pyridoxal phosphate-dependent enzyme [bacterium]|nr:aminotransferase class I/II-fold pyridoxal phosphate-dependent enzyme [bacterium]